jgi:hypothetical protein
VGHFCSLLGLGFVGIILERDEAHC